MFGDIFYSFLHPCMFSLRRGNSFSIHGGISSISVPANPNSTMRSETFGNSHTYPQPQRSNSSRLINLPTEEGSSFKTKQPLRLQNISLVAFTMELASSNRFSQRWSSNFSRVVAFERSGISFREMTNRPLHKKC
ncbi:hypothetical protein Bca101_065086 [Brassica carinata]